jgi:hypothetical protein
VTVAAVLALAVPDVAAGAARGRVLAYACEDAPGCDGAALLCGVKAAALGGAGEALGNGTPTTAEIESAARPEATPLALLEAARRTQAANGPTLVTLAGVDDGRPTAMALVLGSAGGLP